MKMRIYLVVLFIVTAGFTTAALSEIIDEGKSEQILVSVELPPEILEFREGDVESSIKYFIPSEFTLLEASGSKIVLQGSRSLLAKLEARGLDIRQIIPLEPETKAGKRRSLRSFSFSQPWGPLEYPGELITKVMDRSIFYAKNALIVGARNTDWTRGKLYFYDWEGNLEWDADFPLGVNDIKATNLDTDSAYEIIVATRDASNTKGGVYVFGLDGNHRGGWTSESCGIDYIYSFYDLDNDGTDEIVVRPLNHDTFYVLDHNGNLEWSGTVTDNIAGMSFQDLHGDGKRKIVVFSRDTTIPRGQITVFDPAGKTSPGFRNYSGSDLRSTFAPTSASYIDLDGDGTSEIIPNAYYLKEKMEILSDHCEVLCSINLNRQAYLSSWLNADYDFDGDGWNDIAIMARTTSPASLLVQGFIGFNGAGFDTTWSSQTLDKDYGYWSVTAEKIVLGTRDQSAYSGCQVVLLDTTTGNYSAEPLPISGSVDDLKYEDLNNDGAREVAILANAYNNPIHTWTFQVYNQDLLPLVPSGHFSFQSATGSSSSSTTFKLKDLDGDGYTELIPYYKYLGNSVRVANYDGTLKWAYAAPGNVTGLTYNYDIDGDGNYDLAVKSGSSTLLILKDQGSFCGLIGERNFGWELGSVSYFDLNGDKKREIIPQPAFDRYRCVYSYNLADLYWEFTPEGNEVGEVDYSGDLDENGAREIILSSNDLVTPQGYVYVFFGPDPRFPWITDFNGDGTSDIAIFRPASGLWAIRGVTRAYFGSTSDSPMPGDYNGDGTSDIAIFRKDAGLWAVKRVTRTYFGGISDLPLPGDYNADGSTDIGIFRSASGLWAIKGITRSYFGGSSDIPVPGYYGSDGCQTPGIYRPASGLWAIKEVTRVYFGSSADVPVPGDYNRGGKWTPAIFRPASELWTARGVTRAYYGSSADLPIPGGYQGDGKDYLGVFRGSSGLWAIRGVTRVYFGKTGDIPVTR